MTDTRAERAREVMPEDIALLIAKHYAATPDTRRMLQSDIYKALTAFAADEVALVKGAIVAKFQAEHDAADTEAKGLLGIGLKGAARTLFNYAKVWGSAADFVRALKEGNTP